MEKQTKGWKQNYTSMTLSYVKFILPLHFINKKQNVGPTAKNKNLLHILGFGKMSISKTQLHAPILSYLVFDSPSCRD